MKREMKFRKDENVSETYKREQGSVERKAQERKQDVDRGGTEAQEQAPCGGPG